MGCLCAGALGCWFVTKAPAEPARAHELPVGELGWLWIEDAGTLKSHMTLVSRAPQWTLRSKWAQSAMGPCCRTQHQQIIHSAFLESMQGSTQSLGQGLTAPLMQQRGPLQQHSASPQHLGLWFVAVGHRTPVHADGCLQARACQGCSSSAAQLTPPDGHLQFSHCRGWPQPRACICLQLDLIVLPTCSDQQSSVSCR